MTTEYRIAGESVGSCNCAWGCPCQFNALPTHGRCDGVGAFRIDTGYCGDVSLDGCVGAFALALPGPVHEGGGAIQLAFDSRSTAEQRAALESIMCGDLGGMPWEIFAALLPHREDPLVTQISFETNREERVASISVPGLFESHVEPIKNPVTGEPHRARIVLPEGFEFEEAEMGNTLTFKATGAGVLAFEHEQCYAQLNRFDWSNSVA